MSGVDFQVAAMLVRVTETVLWPHIQSWLNSNNHQIEFRCRVGHGQATHHIQRGDQHTLTFGRKMVASKRCARQARNWTTGREMLERGYFQNRFGYPELLAHTCCHEFAHLIQSLNGWYRRGSIHNADFYRILDRMHSSGTADRVLNAVQAEALRLDIDIDFTAVTSESTDFPEKLAMPLKGQRVSFQFRGRRVEGRVTRVHRKTVRIEDHGVAEVDYFRVPPGQLSIIAECEGYSVNGE